MATDPNIRVTRAQTRAQLKFVCVPPSEYMSAAIVAKKFSDQERNQPDGIYHAVVYGTGEANAWRGKFAVYTTKTQIVVRWMG